MVLVFLEMSLGGLIGSVFLRGLQFDWLCLFNGVVCGEVALVLHNCVCSGCVWLFIDRWLGYGA